MTETPNPETATTDTQKHDARSNAEPARESADDGPTRRTYMASLAAAPLASGQVAAAGAGTATVGGPGAESSHGYGHGGYGQGPYGGADDVPSACEYTNGSGVVTTSGLQTAISDWASGGIDTGLLQELIGYWASGDPVSGC